MNFDPAYDAHSERAKSRAAITEKNDKPIDFENQIQAAFDTSGFSLGVLQADHLDGSVPDSTNVRTPTSEGRVQKKEEESKFDEMLRFFSQSTTEWAAVRTDWLKVSRR